jgi:hypothetical protein
MSRFDEAGRTEQSSPSILHATAAGTRPVSGVRSGPWPVIEGALDPGSPLWTPPNAGGLRASHPAASPAILRATTVSR